MQFSELLEKQSHFQELIGSAPSSLDQIRFQILEELGEVARCLRDESRWWAWNGQKHERNREALLSELADVFHFFLLSVICFSPEKVSELEKLWLQWDSWIFTDGPAISLCRLLGTIETPTAFLITFCASIKILGYSQDELTEAYLDKVEKNILRIAPAGSKSVD